MVGKYLKKKGRLIPKRVTNLLNELIKFVSNQ